MKKNKIEFKPKTLNSLSSKEITISENDKLQNRMMLEHLFEKDFVIITNENRSLFKKITRKESSSHRFLLKSLNKIAQKIDKFFKTKTTQSLRIEINSINSQQELINLINSIFPLAISQKTTNTIRHNIKNNENPGDTVSVSLNNLTSHVHSKLEEHGININLPLLSGRNKGKATLFGVTKMGKPEALVLSISGETNIPKSTLIDPDYNMSDDPLVNILKYPWGMKLP